ncbi:MAG: KH domain-containing protein, partial [Nanoarchaeota archaeon]
KMTVKVPSGMTEADLARPVVVVMDFETGKEAYEIYSYGEQTVVVPVQDVKKSGSKGVHKLAELAIQDEFQRYSRNAEVEVISDNKCVVYVPERDIARIIGKQGKTIEMIEKSLGMSVEVRELEGRGKEKTENEAAAPSEKQTEVPYKLEIDKKSIRLNLDIKMQNKDVDLYLGEEFIMSAKAGKTGVIKVKKNNNIGRIILEAIDKGEKVRLLI